MADEQSILDSLKQATFNQEYQKAIHLLKKVKLDKLPDDFHLKVMGGYVGDDNKPLASVFAQNYKKILSLSKKISHEFDRNIFSLDIAEIIKGKRVRTPVMKLLSDGDDSRLSYTRPNVGKDTLSYIKAFKLSDDISIMANSLERSYNLYHEQVSEINEKFNRIKQLINSGKYDTSNISLHSIETEKNQIIINLEGKVLSLADARHLHYHSINIGSLSEKRNDIDHMIDGMEVLGNNYIKQLDRMINNDFIEIGASTVESEASKSIFGIIGEKFTKFNDWIVGLSNRDTTVGKVIIKLDNSGLPPAAQIAVIGLLGIAGTIAFNKTNIKRIKLLNKDLNKFQDRLSLNLKSKLFKFENKLLEDIQNLKNIRKHIFDKQNKKQLINLYNKYFENVFKIIRTSSDLQNDIKLQKEFEKIQNDYLKINERIK
jgi:hypothetical protein